MYVAVPGLHLLVADHVTLLSRGPKENHCRPAIDVLFRSAAAELGARCIGVVLTGLLDDRAAGLAAIGRAGGATVVQHPDDATYPAMPRSAVRRAQPAHVVPLSDMGRLLRELAAERAGRPMGPVPRDIAREVEIVKNPRTASEVLDEWREVPLSCPDCGGPLRRSPREDEPRYRCLVGHAFGLASLLATQREVTEEALWKAVRVLREQAQLLDETERAGAGEVGDDAREGDGDAARADEVRRAAELIERLLLRSGTDE